MSNDDDLRDALERLARRGSARGFDAVLAGAADEAARDALVHDVVDRGSGSGSGDLDPIPFVHTEPTVGRHRRPLGSMIAAAGIAALLVVGTLAVSAAVGNSGSGSGSPQGAVERLADALRHGDPLAAAGVLAPEEVRSLQGTVESAEHKATELQLVQTAGSPLAGVNFDVTGLKLSTQSLADGYVKVVVESGTVSASTHKAQFSPLMQKVLRNGHDNSSSADLSQLAADLKLPTFVVAIHRSGKWYVSAAYTVLEYVREANQLPAGDLGSGTRAVSTLGADTPEAAVQESMRALAQKDWSKLLTMSPPDEIPVYDYRAALVEWFQHNSQPGESSKAAFSIGSMTTTARVDGDTAKVSLKASGTTSGGKWSLDGGCYSYTSNDQTLAEARAFSCYPVGALFFLRFGYDSAKQTDETITVVKEGGRWFVSPVGTALDLVNEAVNGLDRRSLYTMLNVPNLLPPDGALTLGTPVALHGSTIAFDSAKVLTFDGHKGESLLGHASRATKAAAADGETASIDAQVRVFRPDGSEIEDAPGLLHAQSLVLPADGKYTVVLQAFLFTTAEPDISVTIWNTADAPEAAKHDPEASNGTCTYTANSTSCSGSSSSVTVVPSTIGVPGSSSRSSSSSSSSSSGGGSVSASATTSTVVPSTVTSGG